MKTVFKYVLPMHLSNNIAIKMPPGAKVLTCREQDGNICLWVQVDPMLLASEDRIFSYFGTGHPMPENANLKYVGTAMLSGGGLVIHVFEVLQGEDGQ
jgi:hypothetical protein